MATENQKTAEERAQERALREQSNLMAQQRNMLKQQELEMKTQNLAPAQYFAGSDMTGLAQGMGTSAGAEAWLMPHGFIQEARYNDPRLQQLAAPSGPDAADYASPDFKDLYLGSVDEVYDARDRRDEIGMKLMRMGVDLKNPDLSDPVIRGMMNDFNMADSEMRRAARRSQTSQKNFAQINPQLKDFHVSQNTLGDVMSTGEFGIQEARKLLLDPWSDKQLEQWNDDVKTPENDYTSYNQKMAIYNAKIDQFKQMIKDAPDQATKDHLQRRIDNLTRPTMSSLDERKFAEEKKKTARKLGKAKQTVEQLAYDFFIAKNHKNFNGVIGHLRGVQGVTGVDQKGSKLRVKFEKGSPIEIDVSKPEADKALFDLVKQVDKQAIGDVTWAEYKEWTDGWLPPEDINFQYRLDNENYSREKKKTLESFTYDTWENEGKGEGLYDNDYNIPIAPVDDPYIKSSHEMLQDQSIDYSTLSDKGVTVTTKDGKKTTSQRLVQEDIPATISGVHWMSPDEYQADIAARVAKGEEEEDVASTIGAQKNIVVDLALDNGETDKLIFDLGTKSGNEAWDTFLERNGRASDENQQPVGYFEKWHTDVPSAGVKDYKWKHTDRYSTKAPSQGYRPAETTTESKQEEIAKGVTAVSTDPSGVAVGSDGNMYYQENGVWKIVE